MTKGLWQPPRLRTAGENEEERRATWLELFYDLVFVAAIAEVAHNLHGHLSLTGFLGYVLLFVPIWWSWVGATFYATRFDTDDLGHRLLTLLQMVAIAVLAVNVHDGLGKSSDDFALSYVTVRAILILQYLIAGYYVVAARALTNWYIRGFSIAAAIWFVSVFVPVPWQFALWVLALIIDFGTPLTAGKLVAKIPPSFSHIPERVGLFTIIVLGEAVMSVVKGVAQLQWGIASALVALLGMSIAFSLWWIYFDSVDGSPLRAMQVGNMKIGLTWLYSHLPLALGIAATGVGVEYIVVSSKTEIILPSAERWLLCGAVAICLIFLAVIHFITCTLGTTQRRKILAAYRLGAAAFILILAIAGVNLSPLVLMALVALACAVQVVLDLLGSPENK
ncbi:low temperature requirement protein A [Argonema antarcticum]|uniref:low temperature requirement protein A n=1 Tax=Argonema antarcticum TaxID=2942763 RepID=UPI002011A3EA|nr:low temperature requirement protein A [Argonema antarcticum]MCL1470769.1 low temperature requirement protein A [Argonema antarcticum A004/B2]